MASAKSIEQLTDDAAAILNRFEAVQKQISHLQIRDLNPKGAYFLAVTQRSAADIQDKLVEIVDALHALSHHAQPAHRVREAAE